MMLFKDVFASSGNILNTNFNHGDMSSVYKSHLNKNGKARLSRAITEALVSFFDGTINAIGSTTDDELYIEMKSRSGTYEYQILYSHPVIQMYSKTIDLSGKKDKPQRHMFIPIIVEDILNSSNEAIHDGFKIIWEEYEDYKLPFDKNRAKTEMAFFTVHDELYFEHAHQDYQIVVEPINVQIRKDLTDMFTGKPGEFLHTKGVNTAKKTVPKKQVKKASVISTIDFGEPLSQEMLDKIPDLPDYMQIPDYLEDVRAALALGETRSLLLYGATGTGKTTNVKLICRDIKLPLISVINCTSGLDEMALGKFVPKGSEFIFFQSELSDAIEWGGAVVFEEINFGDPKYMSFLNSLLDDNGFVRLDNGKVIKRHPQFRFFATMNPNYEGTNSLNKALKNRFDDIEEVVQISDEDMINSILKEIKIEKGIVEAMIVVMNRIQSKIDNEELDTAISIRNIKNWAKRYLLVGNALEASRKTVINPVSNFDHDLKKEIEDIVKMKFPS